MHSLTYEALHSHLVRLLWCGFASVVCGLAVFLQKPAWRPFATMTAGWGAIDASIALLMHIDGRPFANELIPSVAFNEGLDVAYTAVGLSMLLLAGVRKTIKGFGLAVLIQGSILLILDGRLWLDFAQAAQYK